MKINSTKWIIFLVFSIHTNASCSTDIKSNQWSK